MSVLRGIAILVFILISSSAVCADQSLDRLYQLGYLMYVVSPRIVDVCEEKIPGYAARHEKTFPQWSVLAQDVIKKGEDLMVDLAKREKINLSIIMDQQVSLLKSQIQSSDLSRAKNMCESNLKRMETALSSQ